TSLDGIWPLRYQVRSAARDTPVSADAFSSVTQSEPSSRAPSSSSSSQSSSRSSQSTQPILSCQAFWRNPAISMVLTGLKAQGRLSGMFERFTNKARHVVVLSQEEARLLNHNYIGTEHILLGLLGEPESIGGQVLAGFGLTRGGVREEGVEKIGRGKSMPSGHIPFTPRAKKTLELSLREALSIKHNYIGTEHIVLGLIREGEGVATQIMRRHADGLEIRLAVLNALPAVDPREQADEPEETNAPLRWL